MLGTLLEVLAKGLGIAGPLIAEGRAQQYNELEKKRIEEYQNILEESDHEKQRDKLGGFVMRLCINAGTPIGRLSGTSREVPVECLDALIRIAIENEKQDKMLGSLIETLKNK